MDTTRSDRLFARAVVARWDDASPEARLPDAELMRDALWLMTSRDADLREMGMYLISLGSPAFQAEMYGRVRGHELARDDFARFVHSELHINYRQSDEWRSVDRALRDRPDLAAMIPAMLEQAIASRRRWEQELLGALDPDDNADLQNRIKEVEHRMRVGDYAGRR